MPDLTNLKEYINSKTGRILAIVFIAVIIIAAITTVVLQQEDPEPPEDHPFTEGMEYDYTSVEFTYAYGGPENPDESDEIIPKRVVIHTTDQITGETRLHEFNPTVKGEQSHSVDLKEIADDPDDHLRTHPKINLTVVYTNGARETVATTISPDNIDDIIYTNYRVNNTDSPESILLTFDEVSSQNVTVEAPNKTYTVTEDGSQVKVSPEDYYVDENGDGIYETRGDVKIKKNYHDISSLF